MLPSGCRSRKELCSLSFTAPIANLTQLKQLEFFENFPIPASYYEVALSDRAVGNALSDRAVGNAFSDRAVGNNQMTTSQVADVIYFYIFTNNDQIKKEKKILKNYIIKDPNLAISSDGKFVIMKVLLPTFRRITQSEFDEYCFHHTKIHNSTNSKIWKEFNC